MITQTLQLKPQVTEQSTSLVNMESPPWDFGQVSLGQLGLLTGSSIRKKVVSFPEM